MTTLKGGAAALAIVASCAVATPAAAADDKTPGAFLQCDGRVGHVGDGARFMRLLLLTATAGISETAMSRDGADKRVKGTAGVFACDEALAKEGDAYRRAQLASPGRFIWARTRSGMKRPTQPRKCRSLLVQARVTGG